MSPCNSDTYRFDNSVTVRYRKRYIDRMIEQTLPSYISDALITSINQTTIWQRSHRTQLYE